MYFLNPEKIDEYIVSNLLGGEVSTTNLLVRLRRIRPLKDITKQGFYAAVRKLKKEDIVIVYKKNISLNTVWLSNMEDKFKQSKTLHTSPDSPADFLSLEDKESVSYTFGTIKNMDTFWGHTWNVIMGQTPNTEPIYIYDPHYWFYIARKDLEQHYHKKIVAEKRQFLMTVGGNTVLDKLVKKDFKAPYMQYNFQKMFPNDNYYMTILGDYIVESHLDDKAVKSIGSLFNSHTTINRELTEQLEKILTLKLPSRIKITRNRAKAMKLKKRFDRDFYIARK